MTREEREAKMIEAAKKSLDKSMQRERVRILFERESEETVTKMERIGPKLWRIETESGRLYQVEDYEGQPLSED